MDSVGGKKSSEVNKDAERLLKRQISADSDVELNQEQQVVLQRILQDAPMLMSEKDKEAQKRTRQTIQRPIVRQPAWQSGSAAPESKKGGRRSGGNGRSVGTNGRSAAEQGQINEPDRPKKRSAQSVVITILLIIILSGASFFGWYYWWTTYATFEYSLQPVVVLEGQHVEPSDFMTPGENFQRVSVVYRNPVFRPAAGRQDVLLTLSMGWRIVDASAPLYILTPLPILEHEFAEVRPALTAADLIFNSDAVADASFDLRFVEEPMLLEDYAVGEYNLNLSLDGVPFSVLLSVKDTIAPEATPVNRDIMIGEELRPEDFVTDVSDASDHLPILVTYYGNEADVFGQKQDIAVKVEDYYGNYTIVHAELSVRHNTENPVIEGADTVLSMVGDPIMYLQGVMAFDDFGRNITDRVSVDSSEVDQYTVGVYTITYTVVDFTGLSFETEVLVHVLDLDIDVVNEEVDKILEDIIEEGTTQLEQVHAIFSWVRSNITYAQNRDRPETAYEGAYRALRERRGNCYIYYSISELLLTRAGIPNMLIERIPGTSTRHRWNLINPDGLGWHHFDSYPYPMRLGLGIQRAFFTSSQAAEYTRMVANLEERPMPDYYTYDPSLYPAIVQ